MNFEQLLTSEAVLAEIGQRLNRRRLDLNLTQAEVAEQAGVSKRTIERLEAGGSIQLSTFVRLLRVLDWLGGLERLLPETGPSPIQLLKLKGKERQRASGTSARLQEPSRPWTWGDDDD